MAETSNLNMNLISDIQGILTFGDCVASELLREIIKEEPYSSITDDEIQFLLNWSGDDEYVTVDDIRNG